MRNRRKVLTILGMVAVAFLIEAIAWIGLQDKVSPSCSTHTNVHLDICFYQRKAWHGMYLNEQKTEIFVEVINNSSEFRALQLTATVGSLSQTDRNLGKEFINPIDLPGNSKAEWLFSEQLLDDQWRMDVTIRNRTADNERLAVDQLIFVVHPIQDYINLTIAYGTIFGSSIAAIALIIQFFSNRSNMKELGKQLETQRKQLRLAEDQDKLEFRPWLGKVSILKTDALFSGIAVPLTDTTRLKELETLRLPINGYRYRLTYRNYGKLPILAHTIRYKAVECGKTEWDGPQPSPCISGKMKEFDGGTMMPGEEHFVDFDVQFPFLDMVFVLCSFNYEYATGNGVYRFILELKDAGNMWAPVYNVAK